MSGGMNGVPLLLAAAVFQARAATGYDLFARARYPGPARLEGVDLYKVEQKGGPHAEGYQRRVVRWWPRRGVGLISLDGLGSLDEAERGMPLRTWTLRRRTDGACRLRG